VDGQGLSEKAPASLTLFRNLLSGVLDPDKLDYLCRDAYFCGVPYGVQDIEYIFDRLTLIDDREPALSPSGVTAVEHLLFSKYLMYRTVYWHKTVRIATAMVKKAVFEGLKAEAFAPGDLYMKDDDEFMIMLKTKTAPGNRLLIDLENRRYYKLVYETPFNEANPLHRDLENPEKRSQLEQRLASQAPEAGE